MTITEAEVRAAHDRVRQELVDAGGDPEAITLVAVTKGFGPDAVEAALAAGLHELGENYAQELLAKDAGLASAVTRRWHFIGRLQSNKVRGLVDVVTLWQSIDRLSLVSELAARAPGARCLVQVDAAGVGGRGGCPLDQTPVLVAAAADAGLDVAGLMAVGVAGDRPATEAAFGHLSRWADRLGLAERSMGMSGDLAAAVRAGTTMVRVGTGLFGPDHLERPQITPVIRGIDDPSCETERAILQEESMAGVFRKAMVWLGLGPDDEYDDYGYGYDDPMGRPVPPQRAGPQGQRPQPRSVPDLPVEESHIQPRPGPRPSGSVRPLPVNRPENEPAVNSGVGHPGAANPTVRPMRPSSAKPTVVTPVSFEDAKEVADRFKAEQPVVMHLGEVDKELSRRLIDFASGLCYGLGGNMERVRGAVFLLTPSNVDVSAEERRRLRELGAGAR